MSGVSHPSHEELTQARATISQQKLLIRQLLLEKYEPIAIVGVGLRFPGGNDSLADFTHFLQAGHSGIGPIPADRWDSTFFATTDAGTDSTDVRGRITTVGGGFLDGIDQFDPEFFDISPAEAQYIDPQHRLVLETAWEALENAGIDPTPLRNGDGGVYVGVSAGDYALEVDSLGYEELAAPIATGTAHSALPGRLSCFLGWHGPSIAVDTACSSSLVALHLAVEGLRRGECGIALCGGVNLIHHPRAHILFSQAKLLAPDGRSKTFDDAADGYARSEGCGMIVLKRLSDATRDDDTVLALIRGTAVRQNGGSGAFTVPDDAARAALMRAALTSALLEPGDIQYVEAHALGTPLGDLVEIAAIGTVFAESHSAVAPVVVGTLKPNIGHMEAAAGIGAVVKVALQVRDAVIYPHLHLQTPSRQIPWDSYPIEVPTQQRPWEALTRRALINSYGFAGTIATAVIEQAPAGTIPTCEENDSDAHVFTLSAKSEQALSMLVGKYQRHVEDHPDLSIGDLCYTSNIARAHFGVRLAGVVHDRDELTSLLEQTSARFRQAPRGDAGDRPGIALVFTGQTTACAGLGRSLYERSPVFRGHLDDCDRLFTPHLSRSVRDLLLGKIENPDGPDEAGDTQSALFALEYSAAKMWISWGIRPDTVIGFGIGEIAAAAIAGLFSLSDSVSLIAALGQLSAPQVSAPQVNMFREAVADIGFRESDLTLVSSQTGAVADPAEIRTAEYWARNSGEPSGFAAGLRTIERRGRHVFIEVGPPSTPIDLCRQSVAVSAHRWLTSLRPADTNGSVLHESMAELYTAGVPVSWAEYHRGHERCRTTLPSYAFDRSRYWLPITGKLHTNASE
ncbi:type I polyketide synthase [Frankia sp. Cr1]|uniref:type I polyketide synthase n=1 Tax=Frankia sp. Cr1 TaxID=3073931 RepID=UPI002AD5582E|nr:type I polyketide synthase [Frankia sp. Cr1]